MEIKFYLKRHKDTESTIFANISYEGETLRYCLSEKSLQSIGIKSFNGLIRRGRIFRNTPNLTRGWIISITTIKSTYHKYRNDNSHLIPTPAQLKDLLDIVTGKRVTLFSYGKVLLTE